MKTIGMIIFGEFQLLDLAGPLELFGAANGLLPVLIASTPEPVSPVGWRGHTIVPDATFDETPDLDAVMVPGGVGVWQAIVDGRVLDFLERRAPSTRYLTSVCTGSFVLGAAGLLKGYRATTHWRYMDLLPLFGAQPIEQRVVRDRNRVTAGGVTAGIDFGLEIIGDLVGVKEAEKAQLRLEYAPAPPMQAGHPNVASKDVVDDVAAELASSYDQRERLIRSLTERKKL